MLLINNAEVEKLFSMKHCLEALEEAYDDLLRGDAVYRPRLDLWMPCDRPDGYWRWGTMEGASRKIGVFAIRMNSSGGASGFARLPIPIVHPSLPGGGSPAAMSPLDSTSTRGSPRSLKIRTISSHAYPTTIPPKSSCTPGLSNETVDASASSFTC